MNTQYKKQIKQLSCISVIDDGNLRGFIAPINCISDERFKLILEDIEDTDLNFLSTMHKEYKEAKKKNLLISSEDIKRKLSKL